MTGYVPGWARKNFAKTEGFADGGVATRDPYPSEDEYFRKNPGVTGMAAEDDKVILNPHSKLKDEEREAVRLNESARVIMRREMKPDFDLSDEQSKFLDSTTYKGASKQDRAATIAARIYSGDPSAGKATPQQEEFVGRLRQRMEKR